MTNRPEPDLVLSLRAQSFMWAQLAADEIERLRDALGAVRQYGSDTLSGRIDGPDDRAWQREAVIEMTRRARLALGA